MIAEICASIQTKMAKFSYKHLQHFKHKNAYFAFIFCFLFHEIIYG